MAGDAASVPVVDFTELLFPSNNETIQAERRFERTKLQHGTRKAWMAYANRQAAAVSVMRDPNMRKYTDIGLWRFFLANIGPVPRLHHVAAAAYNKSEGAYNALPLRARITKLIPVLLEHLPHKRARKAPAWEEGSAETAESRVAGGGTRPGKNPADALGGPRAQRQRAAGARRQPQSSTVYSAVPVEQHTALQCPDVGYHSSTESRPYSHSLRACLLAERRCLVCWGTNHSIWNCPQSSKALRRETE